MDEPTSMTSKPINIPYVPQSGKPTHYWRIRKDGFRELHLAKQWHMKGAFAEKRIRGAWIMERIVERHEEYLLCSFQRKSDFWADVTADARDREAKKRRATFRVLRDNAR